MKYEILPWLILFLPLFSAAAITLFTLKHRNVSALLSIGAIVAGFVMTFVFIGANGFHINAETPGVGHAVNWLSIGNLQIDFGLKLDALSLMMMLVVTGVGGAIHIYSYGYMDEDRSKARFFAFMSLFTFSMLGIVLANNFIEMFIFWELVGVSSYLLIGFWFEKPSAADAAKKAFFTNRLGDFGFLLGILVVWTALGSLNFTQLQSTLAANPAALGTIATVAGLLVFCGAMGKSAQFPLHVWLPDAMEGPTPVSALIHAATMVAAGVYMLCRMLFLLNADALHVIAYIGGFTALLAALIAVQQNDIKRIIAYSTLSQLGYMVMAVGLNGPTPAMFHLTTHAFFKALLFLSAGSVIIGMHHEQDIWQMGNLRKKMPVTFWTFLIGALALSGIPPFSGFYSKDSILAQALEQAKIIPCWLSAVCRRRVRRRADGVLHVPVVLRRFLRPGKIQSRLARARIAAGDDAAAGGAGRVRGHRRFHRHHEQLRFAVHCRTRNAFRRAASAGTAAKASSRCSVGIGVAVAGIFLAFSLYKNAATDPLPAKLGGLATAMKNKFYFDELYEATFIRAHDFIAAVVDVIDRWIVEGFCIGLVRGGTDFTGRALRLVQTGNLQTYAFLFVLGVAVVLYFVLGK